MKKVYLIGFRGIGFRDAQFSQEDALIRAGHVGIAFEDAPKHIFGFHPTEAASRAVGDDTAVIEWLKEHHTLAGALQDDSAIFRRADTLAQQGARTTVWQIVIPVEDEDYTRIRQQVLQWYNDGTTFTYAFPRQGEDPPADRDNCATFPRRLGLPLPEPSGQLVKYMAALESAGERWIPEDKES
ncbi:MAG: hypothetical protein SF029_14910 [bacterium]|nr:hypothetical protein [bacterium]